MLVVCLGFIGAGVLISKSYREWQNSPIATSITTQPVGYLEFPVVTICPTRDSNTALYHDLVKAGNQTFTIEDRSDLRVSAKKIINESSYREYVRRMSAISNLGNMGQVVTRHFLLGRC